MARTQENALSTEAVQNRMAQRHGKRNLTIRRYMCISILKPQHLHYKAAASSQKLLPVLPGG